MSSSEEFENEPIFRHSELPQLEILPQFVIESSSDSEDQITGIDSPTTPGTPSTPATPSSHLGNVFSYIGISTQTSEESDFASPKVPQRKRKYQKKVKGFQKGHAKYPNEDVSIHKRSRIALPQLDLFSTLKFSSPTSISEVKTAADGVENSRKLIKPSGNQIFNLEILAQVFSLFTCPNKLCTGCPAFYQQPMCDGLQSFFVFKCNRCHRAIVEFLASLPIAMPPKSCINNKSVQIKGKSEVNTRAMLADHSTSSSWEDFRLFCCLMDLNIPSHNMPKSKLQDFVEATNIVVAKSMKYSADNVKSACINCYHLLFMTQQTAL